jgi:hypothetical protein
MFGFSIAMIWGLVIGTYSTICVAAPLLLYMRLHRIRDGQSKDKPGPDKPKKDSSGPGNPRNEKTAQQGA